MKRTLTTLARSIGVARALAASRRRRRLAGTLASALVLAALAAAAGQAPPAGAFGVAQHEAITREALSFLSEGVLNEIVRGNLSQDHGHDGIKETHHFDSCFFNGSTKYIRNGYTDLVNSLEAESRPKALARAYHLGRVLHPMQDFYAHSNWYEHGRRDLLDPGLGPWEVLSNWQPIRDTGLVVGQGETLPDGWRKESGPPKTAVRDRHNALLRVLITGYTAHGWAVQDACHDDLDFSHEKLNKDEPRAPGRCSDCPPGKPLPVGRDESFAEVRSLAVRQTQHEWCRLLHLSRARSGEAGPSALLGLWARPGALPHPTGTACAARRGPVGWKLRVAEIRVKDPQDDGAAGQMNFRVALYGRDLRSSSIVKIGPVAVEPNQAVPEDRLPAPLTLCTSGKLPPVATVQAWDDDGGDATGQTGVLALYPVVSPPLGTLYNDADDVLDGVTLEIRQPGHVSSDSRDLTVTFVTERLRGPLDPCQTRAGRR